MELFMIGINKYKIYKFHEDINNVEVSISIT